MRKAGAICILLIMLMNGIGFYIYYAVQLKLVRREMREALTRMPEYKLQCLKLTRKEYIKARVDKHEVRVDGCMYDVVRTEVVGDTVLVHCVHDKKEDKLLALVSEITGKPIKDKHLVLAQVVQFISLSFIKPDVNYYYFLDFPTFNEPVSGFYLFPVKIHFCLLETPPPEVLS